MQEDGPHAVAEAKDYDARLFTQLVKPSLFSSLFCGLIAVFVIGGIIAITNFQGSSLQNDFFGGQNRPDQTNQTSESTPDPNAPDNFLGPSYSINDDYGKVNDNFANSDIVRNIPVMAFWMFVGTMVYFVVTGIAGAFKSAQEIEDELHYVHAKRKEMLREVYLKSGIRLVTLAIWLGYVQIFFRIVLPYVLAAAHVAGGNITSFKGVPYIILGSIILVIGLHLHVVMLRLALLRPRVFSQDTSF